MGQLHPQGTLETPKHGSGVPSAWEVDVGALTGQDTTNATGEVRRGSRSQPGGASSVPSEKRKGHAGCSVSAHVPGTRFSCPLPHAGTQILKQLLRGS